LPGVERKSGQWCFWLNNRIRTKLSFRAVSYEWWVLAASLLINTLSAGVYFIGFTVFFLPISREFQVSRAATSLPFTLARFISMFTSPLTGIAIDRYGSYKILLIGGILASLGFMMLHWSTNYLYFLLVFVLVITIGVQNGFDPPSAAMISKWFVKKRGMAFAISSSGFAVGGALVTPLVALSVQSFGWRTTALVIGILIAVITVPVSMVFRRPLPDRQATTESDISTSSTTGVVTYMPTDYSFTQAVRTRAYWLLTFSFGLRGAIWSAVSVHFVAILVWKGVAESQAGLILGIYPMLWLPATLAIGWMADRLPKHRIAAVGGLSGSFGLLLLGLGGNSSIWAILLAFLLLAPNEGSWPLAWGMMTDHFGQKHFGVLRGNMMSVMAFLGIGGPIYSGWVFDSTGSYSLVLIPAAGLLLVASALNWLMPLPGEIVESQSPTPMDQIPVSSDGGADTDPDLS
jgi:MFS family permease